MNELIYQDKPRLKTGLEMLRASMTLENSLHEVTMPFFVLHGEADIVTDPEVSKALYEKAGSKDKTMKLYPEMWHGLTSGEPDENIDIVFSDIIDWLNKRADFAAQNRTNDLKTMNLSETIDDCTSQEEINRVAPTLPGTKKQRLRKIRTRPSFFCGLKGKRLHSAI